MSATADLEYVGFWLRVVAAVIDTVLLLLICVPIVTLVCGEEYWTKPEMLAGPADFLINWVLPAVAVLLFWIYRRAKFPGAEPA
jgi:hypothetical protein